MTGEQAQRFSSDIMEMLHRAGWQPGRDVLETIQLPPGFRLFPAAAHVLAEFGNLRIGYYGPGIDTARDTVEINPMRALYENEEFARVETRLGSTLYPLGEINEGQAFLAIDEQGRTFIVGDLVFYADDTFDAALDRLLTGKRVHRVNMDGQW